jgi:receptor expression-enhancing protein 5/6
MEYYNQVVERLDKDLQSFTPARTLAKKLGVRPGELVAGAGLLLGLLAMLNIFAFVLVTVFSMIYPAYMTWKSIEHNSQEQQRKWLTFWIVMSFVTVFNSLLEWLLSFLPFYHLLKLGLFTWMYYPSWEGSQTLYTHLVKPAFLQVRQKIE